MYICKSYYLKQQNGEMKDLYPNNIYTWINVAGSLVMLAQFWINWWTLASFKMPSGSHVAIQPSRQPGTSHLLDIDPKVITGAILPKTPIGLKGLSPNAKWAYTSSAIIIMPSSLAVSAICSSKLHQNMRCQIGSRLKQTHVTHLG